MAAVEVLSWTAEDQVTKLLQADAEAALLKHRFRAPEQWTRRRSAGKRPANSLQANPESPRSSRLFEGKKVSSAFSSAEQQRSRSGGDSQDNPAPEYATASSGVDTNLLCLGRLDGEVPRGEKEPEASGLQIDPVSSPGNEDSEIEGQWEGKGKDESTASASNRTEGATRGSWLLWAWTQNQRPRSSGGTDSTSNADSGPPRSSSPRSGKSDFSRATLYRARSTSPIGSDLDQGNKAGVLKRRKQLLPFPVFAVPGWKASLKDDLPVGPKEMCAIQQDQQVGIPSSADALNNVEQSSFPDSARLMVLENPSPMGGWDTSLGLPSNGFTAGNQDSGVAPNTPAGSSKDDCSLRRHPAEAESGREVPDFIHQWDICCGSAEKCAVPSPEPDPMHGVRDGALLGGPLEGLKEGESNDCNSNGIKAPEEMTTAVDLALESCAEKIACSPSHAVEENVEQQTHPVSLSPATDMPSAAEGPFLTSAPSDSTIGLSAELLTSCISPDDCKLRSDSAGDQILPDIPEPTSNPPGEADQVAHSSQGEANEGKAEKDEPCEHDVLEDNLRRNGLKQLYMAGDGNCQFRALADQLFGSSEKHLQVRKAVVHHLKQNKVRYAPYVADSFESYLEEMSKEGTWGDHITLQAASDRYKAKITLITAFQDKFDVQILPSDNKAKVEIRLSYYAGRHFNSAHAVGKRCSRGAIAEKRVLWLFPLF